MCCQFWNLTAKSSLNPRQSSVMWPGNLVSIRQTGITRVYLETIIHLVLLLLSLCYCLDCFLLSSSQTFVFVLFERFQSSFGSLSYILRPGGFFLFLRKKKFNNKTITCKPIVTTCSSLPVRHVSSTYYKLSELSNLV